MSDKIQFNNNDVQVTLGDETRNASFAEISEVMSRQTDVPFVLPQSAKYHLHAARDNNNILDVFVLEEKPKIVPIKWKMRKADREYAYEGKPPIMRNNWSILPISVPYVIFIVQLINGHHQRSYAFFRKEPLSTIDDYLLQAPLLNVHRFDSAICVGDFDENMKELNDLPYNKKVPIVLRRFQQHFWASTFNYGYGTTHKKVYAINPVAKWSEASVKNPKFGLEVDWNTAGTTPRQVIDLASSFFARTSWHPHVIVPRILALSKGQQ